MIDPETLRCFAADGAVPTEAEARALAAEVLRLRKIEAAARADIAAEDAHTAAREAAWRHAMAKDVDIKEWQKAALAASAARAELRSVVLGGGQ